MKVGVLAVQGAFREHARALEHCGCTVLEVRRARDLEGIEALVLPGGESTTIGKLIFDFGLAKPILKQVEAGLAVFGTCAGAVLLARDIAGTDQPRLGRMDIRVQRNAYGRQLESFETNLDVPLLGAEPFPAVFIRAPLIEAAGPDVEVLARYGEGIVLARQGRLLAATFHPELTPDLRLHRYFLKVAAGLH